MIKAIGFDLGGTLIEYENVALSWQVLYEEALTLVAETCSTPLSDQMLKDAKEILTKYNTRVNPREKEVKAEVIFREILIAWNNVDPSLLEVAVNTFFDFFQRRTSLFDDTLSILEYLKSKDLKIGILTDVAYGMDRKFVDKDVLLIKSFIDCTFTSVEVGLRKPNKKGFLKLAKCLGVDPAEMIFIGDEEKDVSGAKDVGMIGVYVDRYNNDITVNADYKIKELKELVAIMENNK